MEEKLEQIAIEYLKDVLNNKYDYYFVDSTQNTDNVTIFLNEELAKDHDYEMYVSRYTSSQDAEYINFCKKGFKYHWKCESKENILTIKYLMKEIHKLKFSQVFG